MPHELLPSVRRHSSVGRRSQTYLLYARHGRATANRCGIAESERYCAHRGSMQATSSRRAPRPVDPHQQSQQPCRRARIENRALIALALLSATVLPVTAIAVAVAGGGVASVVALSLALVVLAVGAGLYTEVAFASPPRDLPSLDIASRRGQSSPLGNARPAHRDSHDSTN